MASREYAVTTFNLARKELTWGLALLGTWNEYGEKNIRQAARSSPQVARSKVYLFICSIDLYRGTGQPGWYNVFGKPGLKDGAKHITELSHYP
jgi:hypothetical protein